VGRFLRSVGYRNLDDLKRELRCTAERSWMITDRLDEYRRVTGANAPARDEAAPGGAPGAHDDALARELDAIRHVYQL
ncbi:MurR/RpiR family transcriptional regulator, partial [Burkholderia pseudomallei]